MPNKLSRRRFLRNSSCAAIGYSTVFSTLLNLKAANAAAIANSSTVIGGDYKAMVCILLSGGNDSYNMLVPRDHDTYNQYAASRSNLAIARNQLITINPSNTTQQFGLHPSMPQLSQLFSNNNLAFINNIGTLIEPITSVYDVWDETKKLPLGLQSHADQVMHWQTAFPHQRTGTGWGGKLADMINDMNANQNISMNISLSGTNTFQTGNDTIEFAIDAAQGSTGIIGYNDDWQFNSLRKVAIDNMLDKTYVDAYKKTYVNTINNAKNAHEQFSNALSMTPPMNTDFPNDDYDVGLSMEMIAKTIAARNALGVKRQTFFLDFGGWDHHDEVLNAQGNMLSMLDGALGSFQRAMEEIGCADDVTTFVISDFARTLTSNGNGTDHGWGGNVFALGGAVNGGRMYGEYPDLSLNSNLDTGNGVLYPTTSADEYFAELALWFGVMPSDLPTLFPNLGNFYDVNSGTKPIGFLNY